MGERLRIVERIDVLMQDSKAYTAAEIGALTNCDAGYARLVLGRMVAAGSAHVCGYGGARCEKVFRYGPGENVSKPILETRSAQRDREKSAKRREKRRVANAAVMSALKQYARAGIDQLSLAPAPWWPVADEVVVNAFRAMIDTGRQRLAGRALLDAA